MIGYYNYNRNNAFRTTTPDKEIEVRTIARKLVTRFPPHTLAEPHPAIERLGQLLVRTTFHPCRLMGVVENSLKSLVAREYELFITVT